MDLLAVCDAVLLDATRVRSTMARKRRKTGRRRRLAAAAAAAREGQDGADGAPARAIGAIEGLDYPSTEDGATAATAEEEEEDGEEGSSDDAEEEGEDAGQDGGDAAWGDGLQVPPEAAGRPAAAEEAASSVAEAITQSLLEDFSHSAHAWTHAATRPMQRVLATAVASDRAAPSLPAAPLSATLPTPVDADARALSEEGRALEAGNVNSSDAALADARRVLVDAQAWGPALERVAAQRTAEGTLGDLAAGLPDPSVLLDAAQSGHALLASACRAFGSGAAWLAAVRFAVLCARVEPAGGDAAVAASGDGAWRKAVEVADAAMNHAPARLRYVAGLAAQARGASRRGAEGTGSDGRLDVLRALEHAREEEARCWAEVACLYTGLLRAGGVDEGVMRAAVARVTDLPHLGGQAARVWAAAVDSEALTAAARKAARSGEAGPEPSRKRQRVAGRAGEGRNRDSQSSGEEEEEEEESEEAGAAARCARDAARKLEGEGRARLLMREASLRAAEAAPAREVAASFEVRGSCQAGHSSCCALLTPCFLSLLESQKAAVAASGKGVVAVHEAWASWALAQGSGEVAAVRQLVDRLLALPMPDTTHGRHALFRACLRVERASPAPSTKRVRRIFERAAQALGRSDAGAGKCAFGHSLPPRALTALPRRRALAGVYGLRAGARRRGAGERGAPARHPNADRPFLVHRGGHAAGVVHVGGFVGSFLRQLQPRALFGYTGDTGKLTCSDAPLKRPLK